MGLDWVRFAIRLGWLGQGLGFEDWVGLELELVRAGVSVTVRVRVD